jgi:isoleucyl-tRNA synthetase
MSLAVQAIKVYTSTYLSRGYMDQNKDILYCDSVDSRRRKAAQYVLSQVVPLFFLLLIQILDNYLSMLYPIIPMTIEEAWTHVPVTLKREDAMYKVGWFQPSTEWLRTSLGEEMVLFDTLNENVLQGLEKARQQGYVTISRDQ